MHSITLEFISDVRENERINCMKSDKLHVWQGKDTGNII